VPGYDASFWCGISAPKNTAGDIVEKLNTEIDAEATGGDPSAGCWSWQMTYIQWPHE
jgi:hypothetical protein